MRKDAQGVRVRLKLGDVGRVHHFLVRAHVRIHNFDFTAALVRELVDDARRDMHAQLSRAGF